MKLLLALLFVTGLQALPVYAPFVTCCTPQFPADLTIEELEQNAPQFTIQFNEQHTLVCYTEQFKPGFEECSPPITPWPLTIFKADNPHPPPVINPYPPPVISTPEPRAIVSGLFLALIAVLLFLPRKKGTY